VRSLMVAAVLVLTAVFLLTDPFPYRRPYQAARPVPAWAVDTTPVRTPSLRPEIELAGYTYRCSDCHRLFPSPPETVRSLTQHRHIVLKHGINTRCFNCHHLTNRDVFVDDWGREIPWDRPQLLCAKCHGPVYRDWLNRSHGRTEGHWDERFGALRRRKCIECHDPHQPPFPPMPPALAPDTLRMGDQTSTATHPPGDDPLRLGRKGRDHDAGHHPSGNMP